MAILIDPSEHRILRHVKIKSENNPFDAKDREYFAKRKRDGVIAKPKELPNELDAEESVSY